MRESSGTTWGTFWTLVCLLRCQLLSEKVLACCGAPSPSLALALSLPSLPPSLSLPRSLSLSLSLSLFPSLSMHLRDHTAALRTSWGTILRRSQREPLQGGSPTLLWLQCSLVMGFFAFLPQDSFSHAGAMRLDLRVPNLRIVRF